MTSSCPDISVVVFASRQGILLHGTMLSVDRAARAARERGLDVEVLVVTYNVDQKTASWVAERTSCLTVEAPGACLGGVRNFATGQTKGRYLAFLDGADLWSKNFLIEAHARDRTTKGAVVWRPATTIGFADDYFDHRGYSVGHVPNSIDLQPSAILADNPYPSVFFAKRQIVEETPFPLEDHDRGWNSTDWWWSANLQGNEVEQRTVPETLHYFRTSLAEQRRRAFGTARLGPTTLELGRRRREQIVSGDGPAASF